MLTVSWGFGDDGVERLFRVLRQRALDLDFRLQTRVSPLIEEAPSDCDSLSSS
jgi:hypothetical protein